MNGAEGQIRQGATARGGDPLQTDTLMSCSGSSTSSEIPADEQRDIGISPGLLRLSVGYTGSLESRITQIERALELAGLL